MVCKISSKNNPGSALLHPNCPSLLLLHHSCQARGSLWGYSVLGGWIRGAAPELPCSSPSPWGFVWRQNPSCSSAFGHQSAAFPLSSPAAGSCEPAGDGSRGCALHGHPGEMRPSLLQQVRSISPSRHCCSCGSSFPPHKPCGFSPSSKLPVSKPRSGTAAGLLHRNCFPINVIICLGNQQTGLM